MNTYVSSSFDELVHRLVLGIEPVDAMRAARIARPIDLMLDGVPYPPGTETRTNFDGTTDPLGYLTAIDRHNSCRYVLTYPPDRSSPIAIRLYDRQRRFVPRRISYPVPGDVESSSPTRVRRPALFPGAAYDVSVTATGMRGRVTWNESDEDEAPVRWARVEAAIDGQIVGRAHGDDRGEFLLVLDSGAGGIGDLPSPLVADVTVYGPAAPVEIPDDDPFGDLPLEDADPDDVSDGTTLPDGYAATAFSSRSVTFVLGTLLTDQDKFFFAE